uniref:Histone deacetylase 14 n=1 Tax=Tanacetum cinerariifolium TaxID=118510 RepID=A0A699HEP7_TANCI|nr:hypothetical protein [Tanacetum cinerariifolium]
MFTDCTTKVDSEPLNGSNDDITKPYKCVQTLNVSVGTLNLSTVQAFLFNDKMASADNTLGPTPRRKESLTWSLNLYEMVKLTPGYISSGLVQNLISPTPYVPPSKKDYEIIFQPLFDEYFNLPLRVVSPVPAAVAAPRAVDLAGSPSSTTIDQDVPSANTMADMNIPVNDAPAEQAPAVTPPTKMDDQILPSSKWVPIRKSNCVLDVQKSQKNLIFRLLLYNYQLDEQWFNHYKDILRDALDITPTNDNSPYVAPPSSDTFIEYVNTFGYPDTLKNVSAMSVNALYQPWRAILSMINMCLTEFVQSIQTFLTDRKNLTTASHRKKNPSHLLIPSVRFVGKDSREIFGMPIPDALLTDEIKGASYYGKYQEHVAKYQQLLDAEHGKEKEGGATESPKATKVTKPKAAKATKPVGDKAPKLNSTQPPKPKLAPNQPSKVVPKKKLKLVKDTPDEPSPTKRSNGRLVGKIRKPKSPLKLVDEPSDEDAEQTQGPGRLVVIREPDSRRIQPLLDVQGKGKEKVVDEQAAHDLLTLLTPKSKSPVDQFILQRLPKINIGDQDEGQAGPNPSNHDEGQAGPNPGVQDEGQAGLNHSDAVESQPQSSHVENLKLPSEDLVILKEPASSTETLSSLQNLEKELSFTDQFFVEKQQKEEPAKTNAEAEVRSMVLVPIHKETSPVPPMTTPFIDLTTSQFGSQPQHQ